MTSSTHIESEKGLFSSTILPASILEKSRISLTRLRRASPLWRMVSTFFALLPRQVRVEEKAGHAEHAVHRGADFMADVGDEFRFQPRGLEDADFPRMGH